MDPGKIHKVSTETKFKQPNKPDILYKYQPITEYSLGNLREGKLWSSFPKSFNDPFEFKHQVIGEPGQSDWDELYKNSDMISVVCLTEVPDDLLMWAHYANSHTGFCMAFNITTLTNKVGYINDYPILDFTKDKTNQILDWYRIIHTKSEHWQYEKEHRMIFIVGGETHRDYPGKITSIIFGAKMSEEHKTQIREILSDSVTYYQAELSTTSYEIRVVQI